MHLVQVILSAEIFLERLIKQSIGEPGGDEACSAWLLQSSPHVRCCNPWGDLQSHKKLEPVWQSHGQTEGWLGIPTGPLQHR